VEIGDELQVLRFEHGLAAAFGFDRQLVAPQQRARLSGLLRLTSCALSVSISHCRFHTRRVAEPVATSTSWRVRSAFAQTSA
jgi:hypothetical protein